MNVSAICIRRPVLATVISLLMVLFGVLGYLGLGVREYPAVDPPVITVTTRYRGADANLIDSQITEPLEQVLSGIAGIQTLSSTSREGQSQIRVEFSLDSNLEAAANDVRDKVGQAVRRLPVDADPPSVEKADANSDPIIFLAVQSEERSILDVSHLADTVIKERMQTIPGVSEVRIFGERRYAMRLILDPDKMAAHNVTPTEVLRAVTSENVDRPAGRVEGTTTEMTIRTDGRLSSPEQFADLVIRRSGTRQILLRDVGRVELSAQDMRSGNRSLGIPMVGVAVIPQPNTNAIEIADEFFRRFETVRAALPPDIKLEIGYDFTTFVRRSIAEVTETLLVAFGLVSLIIFLFLRDWRSVIIPVIAIPISIVFAFFIMWLANYSINILTLVALVLAIGLVCDDAIVVLENIYAKVEDGVPPLEAALRGSSEIYFAVISTTVTLAAVFVPIIFLQGLTGRLFREFGVVVVGSVLASAVVALTLSPMLSRYLLRPNHGFLYRITEPFFVFLNAAYRWTLDTFLRFRLAAVLVLAAATAGIIWYGTLLPSELAPMEDRSNIRVSVRAQEGATFEDTSAQVDRLAQFIETKYAAEVHRVFAIGGGFGRAGVNVATVNVYLKEPQDRTRSAFEIQESLSKDAAAFDGLRVTMSMPPSIGDRRGGLPVQFVLQAPNLPALQAALPQFLEEASKQPALRFVDADLKTDRPQIAVEINRAKAAELGVSVDEISTALQLAFADTRYDYFIREGRQYDVIGELDRSSRNDPLDLDVLHVRGASAELIPLASLITKKEEVGLSAIYRYNRALSATVSAGLNPGFTLGDGINAMREAAKVLPPGFTTDLAGQSRDFGESSNSLLYAFLLAVVLIYLVLAAQFESWMDPFIIMLTVPLSLTGAILSLWYWGQSLNVFSQIGIIMLVGLVTKNGILIVEFANQQKEAGLTPIQAVREAAVSRFRPILMTSISTVLGVLPIAMQLGGAAGSRQSLGIAVVGGMVISTVLTLYVVPAMYALLSRPLEHDPGDGLDSSEGVTVLEDEAAPRRAL